MYKVRDDHTDFELRNMRSQASYLVMDSWDNLIYYNVFSYLSIKLPCSIFSYVNYLTTVAVVHNATFGVYRGLAYVFLGFLT